MIPVFNWLLEHWFLIFLLFFFGIFEGIRNFIMDVLDRMVAIATRNRPPAVQTAPSPASPEPAAAPALPAEQEEKLPGPCVHRRVVPVISDEEVVAWLCRSCDKKLPADWAVREEDL